MQKKKKEKFNEDVLRDSLIDRFYYESGRRPEGQPGKNPSKIMKILAGRAKDVPSSQ